MLLYYGHTIKNFVLNATLSVWWHKKNHLVGGGTIEGNVYVAEKRRNYFFFVSDLFSFFSVLVSVLVSEGAATG